MIIRDKIIGSVIVAQLLVIGKILNSQNQIPPPKLISFELKEILPNKDRVIGNIKAPFTLIEFGDYQCHPCAKASERINYILKQYPGKINFAFRHFPLEIHPLAKRIAILSELAWQSGNFEKTHQELYSHISEINEDFLVSRERKYTENYASARFRVQEDIRLAKRLSISATPTLYLCTPRGEIFQITQQEQIETFLR